MQSNTTGISMEILFDIIMVFLLAYLVGRNSSMSKKINKMQENLELLQKQNDEIVDSLLGDFEGVEKLCVLMSQKIDSLPDVLKDDLHRSMLALKDIQEPTKPIKPNNWDSVREAFKGPARIEVNERN